MTTKLLEYADSEISSLGEVSLSALGRVDLSKESTVMKVCVFCGFYSQQSPLCGIDKIFLFLTVSI